MRVNLLVTNARLSAAFQYASDLREVNRLAIADALADLPQPQRPPPAQGPEDGVYIMKAGPYVKIGRAKNVKRRAAAIQTGCPVPLRIMFYGRFYSASLVERAVHAALVRHIMHGEWFRVSAKVAIAALMREVSKFESAAEAGESAPRRFVSRQQRKSYRVARLRNKSYLSYTVKSTTAPAVR